MPRIKVLNMFLLPWQGGLSDHCCFILDFESVSMFEGTFPCVLPENTQKLNCYTESIRDNYNEVLLKLSEHHKIFDKLAELSNLSANISRAEFQLKINRLGNKFCDYMRASEDKCHNFKVNLC